MKKSRLLSAVFACFAVASFNASAELISVDWKIPGDDLITKDTVSGLEWLDLSETLNRSYNSIRGKFDTGGEFEGWMYATTSQMNELYNNAGGQNSLDAVNLLLGLMGTTSSTDRYEQSFILANFNSGSYPRYTETVLINVVTNDKYLEEGRMGVSATVHNMNFSHPEYAHALVRIGEGAVVPVPAAVWLFGSGLLGLVGVVTKKAGKDQ